MPPLQSYKRSRVACHHFPDDQTPRLQTGAGKDDIIYLQGGLDRIDCERQEEEEDAWTHDRSTYLPLMEKMDVYLFRANVTKKEK